LIDPTSFSGSLIVRLKAQIILLDLMGSVALLLWASATAIIFIGLLDVMARLLEKLLPTRMRETDPSRPRYLDESALETPSLALADAARETLRMGDLVETMLRKVMTAMMTNGRWSIRCRIPTTPSTDSTKRSSSTSPSSRVAASTNARASGRWKSSPLPSISSTSATSSTRI
jgi:hypothetical protein